MKIGVIGYGNMGSAMAKALVKNGYTVNTYIRHSRAKDEGINYKNSNVDVVKESDVILFCLKYYQYEDVLNEIKDVLEDKILLSVSPSYTLKDLEKYLPNKKIILMMPNTPAQVSMSMTGICPNDKLKREEIDEIIKMLNSFGKTAEISEEDFKIFGVICGCMPAYVYMFIEAASDGAVLHGFKRDKAYEYISQTLMGAAKMVMETKEHPGKLKDNVTTPGGTTIVGIKSLEESAFRSAIINSIDKVMEKIKNN